MLRKTFVITVLLLAVVALGCSRKFKMPRESISVFSEWSYHRNNYESAGAHTGHFSGQLDVVWELSTRSKPTGPLTINNGYLIYPGSKKKIEIYDAASGGSRGYVRAKSHPQTGMIIQDSLGFFVEAPRRSRLRCINLLNKDILWDIPVRDATAGLIVLDSLVIVSSAEGTVYAVNIKSGETSWTYKADKRIAAPPSSNGKIIIQPTDGGTLIGLDPDSGQELFVAELNAPIIGAAAIGDKAYLCDYEGGVYAVNLDDGSIEWQQSLKAKFWAAPAFAGGVLYLTSTTGRVFALSAEIGEPIWEFSPGDVIRSAPIIAGDYLVFGTMSGRLFSLNARDGTIIDSRQLSGAISISPVTDGQHIYVATNKGELLCLGSTQETVSIK